jgi:hypothetical protein
MNSPDLSAQPHVRQQLDAINERRRTKHLPVARALRDPASAQAVIVAAKIQIHLWREKNLCSYDYISAWECLLLHPEQAADMLEAHSLEAIQLRQNSPFVASVRHFRETDNAA